MKKYLTTIALIITTVTVVYSDTWEYLYLKNGSIIKGKITELKPNEYVKVEQTDGSNVTIKYKEIEKFDNQLPTIEKIPVNLSTMNSLFVIDSVASNYKKRFLLIDIGFLVGTVDNETKAPVSFISLLDLPVANNLFIGLGAGLEFYHQTYVPFIADIRYKPSDRGLSIFFQTGLTIPVDRNSTDNGLKYYYNNGYLINPGLSYTFIQKNETAFTISLGYRYQKTTRNQLERYYNDNYMLTDILNRFVIRFGYTFK